MAKAKVAKKAKKRVLILGIAAEGTCKGNILNEVIDGKWHDIEDLKECRQKPRDSVGWFLTVLKRTGGHADRPFAVERDDHKIRLVYRTKSTPKAPKKSAKTEPSAPVERPA